MRATWVLGILAAATVAGCAGGDAANPNLGAPKLHIAARPDGNLTLFVHGAFGDRLYEWIHVRIDNETLVNRSASFSVEESRAPGFYVDASAELSDEVYVLRARIDHEPAPERLAVSLVGIDGEWAQAERFGLPFERLLERRPQP